MKDTLKDMTSKIHRALISAPEIERVLEETQQTPFTARISSVPIRNIGKLKIPVYEGGTDPRQHMTAFNIAMGRAQFPPKERDAGQCQLFVKHLSDLRLN